MPIASTGENVYKDLPLRKKTLLIHKRPKVGLRLQFSHLSDCLVNYPQRDGYNLDLFCELFPISEPHSVYCICEGASLVC